MINALFWSSMLVFALVAMLLLCRKTYVVYSWPSQYSKNATREYFYSWSEAKARAEQLRQFGYTVIVDEV